MALNCFPSLSFAVQYTVVFNQQRYTANRMDRLSQEIIDLIVRRLFLDRRPDDVENPFVTTPSSRVYGNEQSNVSPLSSSRSVASTTLSFATRCVRRGV